MQMQMQVQIKYYLIFPKTDPNYDATKGVWLISPSVSLPHILDSNLIVDGTSQRLFIGEDTNPDGPELVIDGNNNVNRCLEVNRRGIEIYELTIKNFNFQGIFINSTEDCIISGCYIGTNYNGMESAGMNAGIGVINSSNILIGPSPFLNKANLISGNRYYGISLSDSSQNNIIAGNVIGLNRNLSATFGKNGLGIDFSYSANNRIEDNLIGGNNIGISFGGSDLNIVKNNFIGTDSSWVDFGNNDGIAIWSNASGNKIIENFIGYNKRLGIRVDSSNSIQNYISRNKISRNMGAGIENRYGGNTELAPPIINSVSENQISGTASPNQIIELFADSSNEGQIFIDSTITNESGNFSISISKLPNLPNITATARDLLGNTSEFSSPFVITDIEFKQKIKFQLNLHCIKIIRTRLIQQQ